MYRVIVTPVLASYSGGNVLRWDYSLLIPMLKGIQNELVAVKDRLAGLEIDGQNRLIRDEDPVDWPAERELQEG